MTSQRLVYHGFSCSFVLGTTGHDDMVTCAHNVSLRFISVIWGQARRRGRVGSRGREEWSSEQCRLARGCDLQCFPHVPQDSCLFCTFRTSAHDARPYFAFSSQPATARQPALITGLMHPISLYHESMMIITIRRRGNGCLWDSDSSRRFNDLFET
jgi:hypothetical protein